MTRTRHHRPNFQCPHCGTHMRVRSSFTITDLVRELRIDCENVDCEYVATAQQAIIWTRKSSLTPKPGVIIPFAPANQMARRAANDTAPAPANDDDAPEVASTTLNG